MSKSADYECVADKRLLIMVLMAVQKQLGFGPLNILVEGIKSEVAAIIAVMN